MKKTIRIIDLLNKIANGEEAPKKINYDDLIYIFDIAENNYISEKADYYDGDYITHKYLTESFEFDILNNEVEILDEEEFEDIKSFAIHYSWDYIDYKNIEELKKYVNKDFQNIFDTLDKLIKNQKILIEKLNKNNITQ